MRFLPLFLLAPVLSGCVVGTIASTAVDVVKLPVKVVSAGVNRLREQEGKGVLLITHYTRILRYITPDRVHVFVDGKIAEQGGPELADQLEAEGYDKYLSVAR